MRNTSLTPAVQARICQALKAGNSRRVAAIYGGVAESVFYEWMRRGTDPQYTRGGKLKAGEDVYVEFAEAVTRARAECVVWHVANIKDHAKGDWKASLEWLKRQEPDDWSETQRQDITSKGESMTGFNVFIHRPKDADASNV